MGGLNCDAVIWKGVPNGNDTIWASVFFSFLLLFKIFLGVPLGRPGGFFFLEFFLNLFF